VRFVSIPIWNLARRPARTILTVLGIAFSLGGFVSLVGVSRGLDQALVTGLAERDIHMMGIRRGTVELLTASIDEDAARRVAQVDGVRDVAGELADVVTLGPGHPVLVTGWPRSCFLWKTLRLAAGRVPAGDRPNGVVIGQGLADGFHWKPGDTIQLPGGAFVVSGIFRPSSVINDNLVVLPLSTMQRIWKRPGLVTVLNLRLAHPEDPAAVRAVQARLSAAFPDLTFTETRFVADHNDFLRLARGMAWSVSIIALAMGFFVVLNTLLMSVTERTREFGVLSALGWGPGRVLAMIVIEGLVLCLAGSAVGILMGVLGLRWFAQAPLLHGFLEPAVSPRLVLEAGAATLLLGVAGSLYPAGRAVRISPVEALTYE
jgi:putative ABC transport system permease protein